MIKKVGFNFLWMFSKYNDRPPQKANLQELDFIADEGFNFVRIPTDYRFWTKDFDYTHPDEQIIEYIDNYIDECNKRGLHACLNIHRAPGYCINSPQLEKHNLWRDSQAQEGFKFLWEFFARRYAGISSDKLSFDLINEPSNQPPTHPCSREDHEAVIRNTINAIRIITPDREIVIDGFDGGGTALPELADAGVIHSGRGYEPFQVTHFKAEWVRGSGNWAVPQYPGEVAPGVHRDINTLRNYYKPWRELEARGVSVHIGEFGCYNKLPNDLALRWFNDLISIFNEYNWGYSLWNFKGAFGIADHGRPETKYESYKGMNIDMALLELLKSGLKK
jgi:aryl-phospho-beta-D-glucosidase BglC (GH1 family)